MPLPMPVLGTILIHLKRPHYITPSLPWKQAQLTDSCVGVSICVPTLISAHVLFRAFYVCLVGEGELTLERSLSASLTMQIIFYPGSKCVHSRDALQRL